ncbi:AAA family ATPase [Candidatus Bathyarchaeota archaeon]|nr:AAA family ATPase [Candidatus Bathyarchaeota archaeon]
MKTNVALIGFMGTGKTSVGELLASKLKKRFVSTDDLIVKLAKKSIPDLFKQYGEPRFRDLEIQIVKKVSDEKNIVIDCGGGIILNKINVVRLRKNAKIILLTASPDVVLKRISKDGEKRPLLDAPNKIERIRKLSSCREHLYKESIDFEIDTSNLNVDQVVDKVSEFLKKDSEQDG